MLTRNAALWVACWMPIACVPRSDDRVEPANAAALEDLPPPAICQPGDLVRAGGRAWPDLASALNHTPSGTVTVCPGVHQIYDYSYPHAGPVRIVGATGIPDDAVIDGGGLGAGAMTEWFSNTGGLWLDAVTFAHGGGHNNNEPFAVYGPWVGVLRVTDCVFRDHVGDGTGAIAYHGPEMFMARTVMRDSFSNSNIAGLYLQAVPQVRNLSYQVIDSEFSNLEGWSGAAMGGILGINPFTTRLVVKDTTFTNNVANSGGGVFGFSVRGMDVRTTLERVQFTDNTGYLDGGALSYHADWDGYSYLGLRDVDFTRSTADHASTLGLGAWPSCLHHAPCPNYAFLERVTFHGNTSNQPWYGTLSSDGWRVRMRDVDFGLGPDTNLPFDLTDCPLDLGAGATGFTDTRNGVDCP